MKGKEAQLSELLLKLAKGCRVQEVVEEYAEVDGQMRLTKRKETRKDIPPDLKAVQMLMGSGAEDESGWSDEQLEEEKARLLAVLQEKTEKKGKVKKEKKDD
ncbi:MAG: hypothetical protein IKC37_03370 [Clostridia bacterium]|nr:hypothetical protein [Clostridia bacterium]